MWNRGWGELKFAEIGREEAISMPSGEGKSDKGCAGAFWDD